jgi:hypothetical protein
MRAAVGKAVPPLAGELLAEKPVGEPGLCDATLCTELRVPPAAANASRPDR